jgi:hypothetical protein
MVGSTADVAYFFYQLLGLPKSVISDLSLAQMARFETLPAGPWAVARQLVGRLCALSRLPHAAPARVHSC